VLLTWSFLVPGLAALPAEVFLAILASDELILVFLLDHVATAASFEAEMQELSLVKSVLPLAAGEVLVRLFAGGAEPPTAHHALETPPLLHLLLLENLLAAGSRAEKVSLVG
jgi:hypothetical protein